MLNEQFWLQQECPHIVHRDWRSNGLFISLGLGLGFDINRLRKVYSLTPQDRSAKLAADLSRCSNRYSTSTK